VLQFNNVEPNVVMLPRDIKRFSKLQQYGQFVNLSVKKTIRHQQMFYFMEPQKDKILLIQWSVKGK